MPEIPQLAIRDWIDDAQDWVTDNLGWLLDFITEVLGFLVDNIEALLLWPEPLVLALILAGVGWFVRSWKFAIYTLVSFALIESMRFWESTMSTLSLVLVAAGLAAIIGVPVGILIARSDLAGALVRPVLDFMQTMPALVYLVPAVTFFSVGTTPGVVATIIFAMPPAVRLTELGIRQVDSEVVEAGEAFGATPRQILVKIQLPLATPTIMAGINQVIMLALSMVVLAGFVGAGGLGGDVVAAMTRLNVGAGFEAGLSVVIIAVFLDRITASLGDRSRSRVKESV